MNIQQNIIQPLKKGNSAFCNNINEPRGHSGKRNKPDTERQILYGVTYMWNHKKGKLLEPESRAVVTRGWVCWGKWGALVKEYKLSVIK